MFTFNVLDEFIINSLECKTSVCGLSAFHTTHDSNQPRKLGDLSFFCVTCPQLGKNVSMEELENSMNLSAIPGCKIVVLTVGTASKLYRPQAVAIGNFKLKNLKMQNPSDNCSTCNDNHTVNETNAKRKDVDSTGIGAYQTVLAHWVLHWMERFKAGEYLLFREDLELSATVDGEILETLWAVLDKVVGSTCSMSCVHCQEVLDDYMNDSNGKKTVGAVRSLIAKMNRATAGLATMQEAFDQLSSHMGADFIRKWEDEERDALKTGGIGYKIYKAADTDNPGVAEMCLRLMEEQLKSDGELSGSIALITDGLNIEKGQNKLASLVPSLGNRPTAAEKRDLLNKRDRLEKCVSKFEKSMTFPLSVKDSPGNDSDVEEESTSNEEEIISTDDGESTSDDQGSGDKEWQENDEEDTDMEPAAKVPAENIQLSLPSRLKKRRDGSSRIYEDLCCQEATLRVNQINKALHGLQMALGDKAWMLRNTVRSALQHMGQAGDWPPITRADLKMRGDLTEANRMGQQSDTLAWFWRLEDLGAEEEMQRSGRMSEFYRVNWLRAKARLQCWKEEDLIVSHEMMWTINSFNYLWDQWRLRADAMETGEDGLKPYTEKQVDLWRQFAENAQEMFDWAWITSKKDHWRKKGPALTLITVN
ncbi:hypothetical protein C8J57DRAFT_1252507 [Mycena rebaudengoi]|nr:hypothetical protein C8J57DRAFT_1252507 [Mycena rebaudengoi]